MTVNSLVILGIRGIPAAHGGFETFAEKLSLYLISRGWEVSVYCQADDGEGVKIDYWNGVRRVHVPVERKGAAGTILFDWKSIGHVLLGASPPPVALTLGYNTAAFTFRLRAAGIRNVINMDGLEWRREKWSKLERLWLFINERIGAALAHRLIADHPKIHEYLCQFSSAEKVSMIPYGADEVTEASSSLLLDFGLSPSSNYILLVARPEPENSILQIVEAFSSRVRNAKLVILGAYSSAVAYQKRVLDAASSEVMFVGAIYDQSVVRALRFHATAYVHGHTVGGTNPSLVEAMGSGNCILAHDNPFNRWVAGGESLYFRDIESCSDAFRELLSDSSGRERRGKYSRSRYHRDFRWEIVLRAYEELLVGELARNAINQTDV